jgi:hypothetical protein
MLAKWAVSERRDYTGGSMRPIYDDGKRQYVIDDDGFKVYGVWLIPEDEPVLPLIVPADEDKP